MLIKTLALGGAERHVVDLAVELRRRGHAVSVLFSDRHLDALRAELVAHGVEVAAVGGGGAGSLLRDLARELRRIAPDVVHAHSPRLKFLARMLRPVLGYRLVTTYHNTFARHHPLIRLGERLTHGMDDVRISCSQEVADTMHWPSRVVPNGIRLPSGPDGSGGLRSRLQLDAGTLLFSCVANLWQKKNHAGLVDAFARAFGTAGGDALPHLVLFGEGDERGALRAHIDALGIGARVHLLGADPDAARLTSGADVFCLVSFHEGLPLALLEAMANGLPCVVSRAGGMPTVVQHGATGLVVDATDTAAIADAMRTLAADAGLRRAMGQAGRQRIERDYQLSTMVDRVLALYAAP